MIAEGFDENMTEAVVGGAALAWRLLATLEGGSFLLATSALLAYTARNRLTKRPQPRRRTINTVLITNSDNILGKHLKTQLESRGCAVKTATEDVLDGARSGAVTRVDALVVIGAVPRTECLNGMAEFVSEDVYNNLKTLENLSVMVRPGGCIAWACAGAGADNSAYSVAGAAFDAVVQASLQHVAENSHCESIWIDRSECAERTAQRVTDALLPYTTPNNASKFSIRDIAKTIGKYVCRGLKIIT
ncbi:uncharacterized protein LOC113517806 [Galleria mellonella]|uniref:Uncharacterized protein LOC113517806 n=1 Tax=Galleria mellonella TaxID=7137 RepID=A0ABM3MFN1_GALME|nr:uncharacterized protein LOC113517806 [Galleria mellonella]